MKTSKKKSLKAVGVLLVLLLAGIIFFFTYYQVDEVQPSILIIFGTF